MWGVARTAKMCHRSSATGSTTGTSPCATSLRRWSCWRSSSTNSTPSLIKLVVDLTPADGKFAYACLKCRVGYVGVAYTEAHAKLLEERLVTLLSEAMQDSNSPLFNSAQAVTEGSGGKHRPKPRPKPEPKPKPGPKPKPDGKPDGKPKAKPKPKNKGKRGRKGGEDGGNPKKQKTGEQEDGEEKEEEDDELWDPLSG